jgi:hypothetical protein
MPELTPQSTSPSSPAPPPVPAGTLPIPPESIPPAVPPILDPVLWEDFPVFRETFLMYISEPEFNASLRRVGEYFFGMLLECYGDWPEWPESSTRTELRAAVADLRHLEGFLASVGQEHAVASLPWQDARLSRFAARQAAEVARIAHRIEQELAQWAGEAEGA